MMGITLKVTYEVNTDNIDDTINFASKEDALGFIADQLDMGFGCTIKVAEDEPIETPKSEVHYCQRCGGYRIY